jgi:hypothetical protein
LASTVDTGDIKVRLHETPPMAAVQPDQRILLDGPVSGPGNANAAVIAAAGLRDTPETIATPSRAAQVLLQDGGLIRKYDLINAVGRENQWYLGPYSIAPASSALGLPIAPGNTYFDTSTLQMYVYTGTALGWQVQAQLLPASLKTYAWYCRTAQLSFPDRGDNPRDVHGQLLQFELSAPEDVAVFLNGAKLVLGVDYFLRPDITVDLAEPACADSIVEIRVAKRVEVNYATSAVMVRTSAWVFDGVQTRFPLYDTSGRRLTAASSVNCLLSVNSRLPRPSCGCRSGCRSSRPSSTTRSRSAAGASWRSPRANRCCSPARPRSWSPTI